MITVIAVLALLALSVALQIIGTVMIVKTQLHAQRLLRQFEQALQDATRDQT